MHCLSPAPPRQVFALGHDKAVGFERSICAGDDNVIAIRVQAAQSAAQQSSCLYLCGTCWRSEISRTTAARLPFMARLAMFLLIAFSLTALGAIISAIPFERSRSLALDPLEKKLRRFGVPLEAGAARRPGRSPKQAHFPLCCTSLWPIA